MDEFLQPFVRMLDGASAPAVLRAMERGDPAGDFWAAIRESGVLDLLVPEDKGGLGLSLLGAAPFISALGARGLQHPVAETLIARGVLTQSGADAPDGAIALASGLGPSQVCPGALAAEWVLIDSGDALALVRAQQVSLEPTGVEGSLAARLSWDGADAAMTAPRPAGGLRPIAAVTRALQIAGAADRLLEMSAAYANERVQFGKPIGRQQALQQNLAIMAEDSVAARIAAQLGAASGLPPKLAAAAAAKVTASSAAARIAATAHAVHGAIGVSAEFDLQLLTRRLHEWRLADGSEGYWSKLLGGVRMKNERGSVDFIRAQAFLEGAG